MEFRFTVERGHVALFARALGDLDAGYPDGGEPRIPPTFLSASALFDPESGSRPRPSGAPLPARRGGVAAEAHFEYHRPVRIGDEFVVSRRPGATWQKSGRRGGTLTFTETITEFRDAEGEVAVTVRRVAVRTERPIGTGPPAGPA